MARTRDLPRLLAFTWLSHAAIFSGTTADAAPGRVEFNRDIRPILSDRCFTCHGPDKANRKTALRFDIEDGAFLKLNSGGFAIVRGKPDESEMVRRITSDNDILRMPPAYEGHAKLGEQEIGLIRRWIEQGAPWQPHWSFIAPARPPLPNVEQTDWPRNAIDHFVLARLEREGMKPSPEAERRTLARRVTLDLTGLPPTPAEIDRFLNDSPEKAYENLVDRLLASPRFGERMAVRWLDAARYADTNGYQSDGVRDMWRWRDWVIDAFNRNMPFDQFTVEQIAGDMLPGATRDQRIATAFNRNHRTNAEGGIVEEEFRVEYVADRVETTSTVWLGLTVGCARCHDHKFDPILQKDFYKLFAFFNNVPERGLVYNFGNEAPFIQAPTAEHEARLAELDGKLAAAKKRWTDLQPEVEREQTAWERSLGGSPEIDWTVSDSLSAEITLDGELAIDVGGCVEGSDCELPLVAGKRGKAGEFDGKRFVDAGDVGAFNYLEAFSLAAWIYPAAPNGAIVSREEDAPEGEGYGFYLKDGKLWLHITRRWTDISLRLETVEPVAMNRWQHVAMTYDGKHKGKGVRIYVDGEPRDIKILFDELTYPFGAKEPFKIGAGGGPNNRFHGRIDDVRIFDGALSADEVAALTVLESVSGIGAMPATDRSAPQQAKLRLCFLDRFTRREIRQAGRDLKYAQHKRDEYFEKIPTVMVMEEMAAPREAFVLNRGAYENHGERVEPGVPEFLPPLGAGLPQNRLGFARWLVSRENPLSARVTVNRFWQMLFGTGLVKTVEDFGSQGEWPIHPEMLDWLATEFMDSGWNIRGIVKTIVMSGTYRQSSKVTPDGLERDPENRLLARGPRYRLPAEVVRDQALAISGLLLGDLGGPSVKPYQPAGLWEELSGTRYLPDFGAGLYRRSLYTYWKRTVAPPSMITFDSTDRESCTVRQVRTNTPLQALNLMNDVAFVEASRVLAERMIRAGKSAPARIAFAFERATGRPPRLAESAVLEKALRRFEAHYRENPAEAWELLHEGHAGFDESLDIGEVAAYAGVASLILNLDETVTKE